MVVFKRCGLGAEKVKQAMLKPSALAQFWEFAVGYLLKTWLMTAAFTPLVAGVQVPVTRQP